MRALALMGLLLAGCGGRALAPAFGGHGEAPRKALLVGVEAYADPDLPPARGALDDVENMRDLLVERFGFAPADVRVLEGSAATRQGILDAFEAHLVADAAPGGLVYFHFSGHGSQIFDRSGDEADGWDETLMPYDSGRGKLANRDVLDDELGLLFDRVRARGAQAVFVLDSCHGGTGTRADGGRGVPADLRGAPDGVSPPRISSLARSRADRGYTLISATAAVERARAFRDAGGQWHGALTYFLARALRRAGPKTTWRELMGTVGDRVSTLFPNQHPQLEGDLDAPLFRGGGVPARAGYRWRRKGPKLLIQAGRVHGIGVGALFELRDLAGKTVGKARVLRSGSTQSEAAEQGAEQGAGAGVARLLERGVETQRLAVHLKGGGHLMGPLRARVSADPRFETREEGAAAVAQVGPDWILVKGPVEGPTGAPVPNGSSDAIDRVMRDLRRWAKWWAVWRLDAADALAVDFELQREGRTTTSVGPGQRARVIVRNGTGRRFYLSILGLSDDGSLDSLYPDPGAHPFIEAGAQFALPIRFALDGGRVRSVDRLKLVMTSTPVDLSPLTVAPTRGAAPADPLSRWALAVGLGVRGAQSGSIPKDAWVTREMVIVVEKDASR